MAKGRNIEDIWRGRRYRHSYGEMNIKFDTAGVITPVVCMSLTLPYSIHVAFCSFTNVHRPSNLRAAGSECLQCLGTVWNLLYAQISVTRVAAPPRVCQRRVMI